jgi:predicted hydrolase (HD superfamily)
VARAGASPGTKNEAQKNLRSNLQRNLRYNTCGCQEQFRVKHKTPWAKSKVSRRKNGENRYESMSNREQAWGLLTEFTQSESLRKHALAVEACMRACARKFSAASPGATPDAGQEKEELWGVVGLLHDFDYEQYPSLDDHPYKGNEILKERGYTEEIRRAIMSHAEYSGVTRDSLMEKALFACDELAGFITACALVKPRKSLGEVEAKSVRKKMKDKAFARSVKREDIVNGAADLGVDLEEHIAFCIEALRGIAGQLGLDGSAAQASSM